MAGFAKVFESILTSTLWCEEHYVVRVWIAMLARADAEGMVEGSIPGFAHLCRVSVDEMQQAIDRLASPDPFSRTKDNEGRRIEVFDGGWRILNHAKYRAQAQAKEGSRAPYMRDYRSRKRAELFREEPSERDPGEEG